MPHKHRLKGTDASSHELPPTSIAQPLPVSKPLKPHHHHQQHKPSQKRNNHVKDNDTPRAFTRLMNYTSTRHKPPRGLDDGGTTTPSATNKKRKRSSHNDEDQAGAPNAPKDVSTNPTLPKILPGERMADFSARVNHALPVVGLVGKGKGKGVEGLRERQTKTERKMQRMQKEWREGDRRRKERMAEVEEEGEGRDDDGGGGGVGGGSGKGRKKKKKGKGGKKRGGSGKEGVDDDDDGDDDDDDEDPWAIVAANRKREQEEKEKGEGKGGLVGLHDVVLAPPKFTKVPIKKVDVADVVRKGGLKRQVELSEARISVIEGYRRMMRERREEGVSIGRA
ncbi:MAG: hypothetical protein L6R36_004205 [Xanthoria steineri]|nr:MAG: hypothetical protein L6R36_004205 [Xanthoria steineri]